MIIGKGISKTFIGDPLFTNLNFKLGNNKKVALVGKNGTGKSTLFKIIAGNYEPDNGGLSISGEVIAYIPQEFDFPEMKIEDYLYTFLENEWDFYKIDILRVELNFQNYNPNQLISSLSEGQKMKLKIIEVMLKDPTTILIDEPTNHLDIDGIRWFESYLKTLNKTVLMISHDREFLNNTVTEIWEIENKKLTVFNGNYDFYYEEKLRLIGKWNEEYIIFKKKKDQLERLLARVAGTYGVKAVKSRINREIEGNKKEKYESKKIKEINFNPGVTHSKLMVRFSNVSKTYDNQNFIFKDLNIEIRGGEKVWLFGPNGAGKSTIVKMILGQENSSHGEVRIGDNISIGYFAQKQTTLNFDESLLDFYMKSTGCGFGEAHGILKNYMFTGDELKVKIRDLSPGQRARFSFAIFTYKNYDMLILDEPDNHLDIETKEVIEDSLKKYKGTLFLISHDRFFVEKIDVSSIYKIEDGKIQKLLLN